MIKLEGRANINAKKLEAIANRAGLKALPKAAAYVRGVARRKVKRRNRRSSAPGMPPYAHSGVFKPSILYGIDRGSDPAAYVGPQRLAEKRTNMAGQPVPEILEFGGMAALGRNPWFHNRNVPNLRNIAQVADYFAKIGSGPAYWGLTPSSVQAKMVRGGRGKSEKSASGKGGGGSNSRYQRYQRFSPLKGRKVYLANIKINTPQQAMKVARTVVEVFGYPVTNRPIRIAPRPLMGPSLEESKAQIAQFFKN